MPPYRIEWLDDARSDIRALEREIAMRVFDSVLQFSRTGNGNVAALHGELSGAARLRVGDYRVLFRLTGGAMRIFAVRHRSEAYR